MATTEENQLEQAVLCCVDPAVNPTVRKQVQPPFTLHHFLKALTLIFYLLGPGLSGEH